MHTNRDDWWLAEFSAADPGPVDYLSRDGKTAVEVKRSAHGVRGMYSAVMQLAVYLEHNPKVERACLVLNGTRMSLPRLQEEWKSVKTVLRSEVARRISVAVVEGGQIWVSPDEPYLRRIAKALERAPHIGHKSWRKSVRPPPGHKPFEIVKVLMIRWLQHQGPIPIGELADQTGCSYPTVRKAFEKSTLRQALRFTSNRSVELKMFPHDAWRELVALSSSLRGSLRFRDCSGERPLSHDLLRRLESIRPPNVALGGTIAARHWHPDFDLHGTPRTDLEYHAPNGDVEFDFVRKVDPALTPTSDPTEPAVLVIHPVRRAASLFSEEGKEKLPVADPVETALDLCDLSLATQANQLLTHLRPEIRLT